MSSSDLEQSQSGEFFSQRTFVWLTVLMIIANATGLFNTIFTADSALYASISKTMAETGNFVELFLDGKDWLDKPHFPFWVCALSMKLFGINTFAYKLPSLLFFLIGLLYTFKLAKSLYNTQVAYLATLILGSSLHIIISNNDVRAEAILLGLIMGGVYYMYRLSRRFTAQDVFLASLFCAAAVMTKGIYILIIIYSAVFGHLLFKKSFDKLKDYRWSFVFLLTLVFILPELYALYVQFDLHPEKTVFGKQGTSGITFFLWDSQFGRFFNTGPIKGKGDLFFFVHTLLWAFAPWAILGYAALLGFVKDLFKKRMVSEYLIFFGFSIMFILFSLSKFQLPHYTNNILPFLAILTAALLIKNEGIRKIKMMSIFSINLYVILFLVLTALLAFFFRASTISILSAVLIFISILSLTVFYNFYRTKSVKTHFLYGFLATLLFSLYLNTGFYPELLKYQSDSEAAFFANSEYADHKLIAIERTWLLPYYAKNEYSRFDGIAELKKLDRSTNYLLYANGKFLKEIEANNMEYEIIKSFDDFHITRLNWDFINYRTRNEAVQKMFLVTINTRP